MTDAPRQVILVITDGELLAESVTRALQVGLGESSAVFWMRYAQCAAVLTPERIDETDLFILELFRRYPGGLRAEGVALALKLAGRSKPSLVIAPLHLSEAIGSVGYWDVESKTSLPDAVARLLRSADEATRDIERLRSCFGFLLAVPEQHGGVEERA